MNVGTDRKPRVQLTDDQRKEIWLLRNGPETPTAIAKRFGLSLAHVCRIQDRGRYCKGGCRRITTSESGRCKKCAPRREPSVLTNSLRTQIRELRSRGFTYASISERLNISVSSVRNVLDPGYKGKRSIKDGIVRIEHRRGEVTFHAIVRDPSSRKQIHLAPEPTHEAAEEARRRWKAQRLGVNTPTPRKSKPDLTDVYGNVRLALQNLDGAEIPELQAREIFAVLHEAEDLIQRALRDVYSGRFRTGVAA